MKASKYLVFFYLSRNKLVLKLLCFEIRIAEFVFFFKKSFGKVLAKVFRVCFLERYTHELFDLILIYVAEAK